MPRVRLVLAAVLLSGCTSDSENPVLAVKFLPSTTGATTDLTLTAKQAITVKDIAANDRSCFPKEVLHTTNGHSGLPNSLAPSEVVIARNFPCLVQSLDVKTDAGIHSFVLSPPVAPAGAGAAKVPSKAPEPIAARPESPAAPAKSSAPSDPDEPEEGSAQYLLSRVRVYGGLGIEDLARKHVAQLQEKYPGSPEAKQAQAQIEQLLSTAKASSARATERSNQEAAQASKWSYSQDSDPMSGESVRQASITSETYFELDSPYDGTQRAELVLRRHPRYGVDVIFRVETGQLDCNASECSLIVRFDEDRATSWPASEPQSHDSTMLFVRDAQKFIDRVKRAEHVRIEAHFFRQSPVVLDFDVKNYDKEFLRVGN